MDAKSLVYFSWFITLATLVLIYGGLHLNNYGKNILLNFSLFLVMTAHTPAMIMAIFRKERSNNIKLRTLLLLTISCILQVYILSK